MTGSAGQAWFDEARLGMFIHWDHASQQGLEVSWPLVGEIFALPLSRPVSVEQYHSSAATFDPSGWDAVEVAKLARDAGMRYLVFTAKHHSGYAMFHTKLSDFSVEHSPYGRDIVGEYVEATRNAGLRVGLYFSLSDWHHPDYPTFTEDDKPYRLGASPPLPTAEQWSRYLEFMFGQIEELLTNYGRIDLLWFDGGWERPDWRASDLERLIRSLQPEILINDRLPGTGDFSTPEQFVPATPPTRRWETCMTMNESWGYNPNDDRYKSARTLVHSLCEVAGKGGNLLLNVSPRGDGTLPPEQIDRLKVLSEWMSANSASITATTPGLEASQFYGPSTRLGDTVFVHLLMRPYDTFDVRGVPVKRLRRVWHVASGKDLEFRTRTGIIEGLMPDPPGNVTVTVPSELVDDYATVVALDFDTAAV